MTVWGISGLFHDAAISVVKNGKLIFASSSERYSRIKNDKHLNQALIKDALNHGYPDTITWYESPLKKKLRCLLFDKALIHYNVKSYLKQFGLSAPISFLDHHTSHLYSSLLTYPKNIENILGVVVDSVGEFNTISIWDIRSKDKIKMIYSRGYPDSLGLFYSSITDLVGLKPLEDEYILMGMSSYGKSKRYYTLFKELFFKNGNLIFDLRHGCKHLFSEEEVLNNRFDIALGAQLIFEEVLIKLVKKFLLITGYRNIVYSGGCALNCRANSLLLNLADKVWIFPNPGDAGASLGAALHYTKQKINIDNMFLGYDAGNITNINEIVSVLKSDHVVGVINGKAEFGPRALGHRSIFADPRLKNIKSIVNDIKGREQFRPFAPVVLKEYAKDYFKIDNRNDYRFMQFTAVCTKPRIIPGAVHTDGSSRIQVVDRYTPFVYSLLLEWYKQTGCPVLINTSLNIKGKPLINSLEDISEFKNRSFKIVTSAGCL